MSRPTSEALTHRRSRAPSKGDRKSARVGRGSQPRSENESSELRIPAGACSLAHGADLFLAPVVGARSRRCPHSDRGWRSRSRGVFRSNRVARVSNAALRGARAGPLASKNGPQASDRAWLLEPGDLSRPCQAPRVEHPRGSRAHGRFCVALSSPVGAMFPASDPRYSDRERMGDQEKARSPVLEPSIVAKAPLVPAGC